MWINFFVYVTHHSEILPILCPSARCLPPVWWKVAGSQSCFIHRSSFSAINQIQILWGNIWPFLSDTFLYLIVEHVCVFGLCVWLMCLTARIQEKQCMQVLLHVVLCCVCGARWGCLECCCFFKSKGNEIQHRMNYRVCIVTPSALFRVYERIEFMCERCSNKNTKRSVLQTYSHIGYVFPMVGLQVWCLWNPKFLSFHS